MANNKFIDLLSRTKAREEDRKIKEVIYNKPLTDAEYKELRKSERKEVSLSNMIRSASQEKALQTRAFNMQYIKEHPFRDYHKGTIQSLCVQRATMDYMYYASKGFEVAFMLCIGEQRIKQAEHDFKALSRKGEDFTRVCESKANAYTTQEYRVFLKVLQTIYISMGFNGTIEATFFTGTFSPSYMKATTYKQRRRAVRVWAESQGCVAYLINVDYGKKNGREHYHLVFSGQVDVNSWREKFHSRCYVERVWGDPEHLSSYVDKLTNHAVKETTKKPGACSTMSSNSLHDVKKRTDLRLNLPYCSGEGVSLNDGKFHYANGETANDEDLSQ